MTAATSPRLGLMLPTDTDTFTPVDFVNTFSILDGAPGVIPVANYAALPTTLTSAQHGSLYLELDNSALWMWNRPGSSPGSWVRINNNGIMSVTAQSSTVSTTSELYGSGPTLVSKTFTAIGGRQYVGWFYHPSITNSSAYGASSVILSLDGSMIGQSIEYSGVPGYGVSHQNFVPLGVLAPGSSHTLTASLNAINGLAGTSAADNRGRLVIWET